MLKTPVTAVLQFTTIGLGCLVSLFAPFAKGQDAGTNAYVQSNLVSDVANTAMHTDTHLVNPGLPKGLVTPWWVADANTGDLTLYLGGGNRLPIVVTIPPASGTGLSNR
jgi:hypothetical protein